VTTLIRTPKHGIASLEAATGGSFEDLFRRWTIDLARSELQIAPVGGPSQGSAGLDDSHTFSGPRTAWVGPGERHSWSSAGTAPHFITIGGSSTGRSHVEIDAPPSANLQVTAIPLPDDLPRLELAVQNATQPNGAPAISLSVRELSGNTVQLHNLSWGPMVPSANPRTSTTTSRLDSAQLAAILGTSYLNSRGLLVSRPITVISIQDVSETAYFKLVGTDGMGRKVSAWALLNCSRD
jgi:hypothetical protein